MRKFIKLGLILMSSMLLIGCDKQVEQQEEIPTFAFNAEEEHQPLVMENDKLKFTLNPETTYFEVLNKVNNSIWKSNPDDAANDPVADPTNRNYLLSTIILEYTNNTGITVVFNNFEKSILKTTYQISQQNDAIQVDYTIGDLKKIYYIPPALPESRMKVYLDQMESKNSRKVNSYYRKIDLSKLRPTDDKNALLEKYPELAEESVYEIRSDVQNHLKLQMQEFFAAAGYTMADYEADMAKYSTESTDELPYFNISVIYRLEGDDLVVEVPYDKMQWKAGFPITKVKVLPFLGAGNSDDEGFILVPEGNGGIINFNNGKAEQNAYYVDVYGWDLGLERVSMTDENYTAFPVFGISNNGNSMLCILEDYASVAKIEADVSGNGHSYNFANASYTTMHYSELKVSAKTDKSVIMFEDKKPTGTIKQRYRFLNTDSYVKMAEAYRGYLTDKYPQMTKNDDTSTPVNITLIGAIDKDVQRFGIPVSVPAELTSYKEAYQLIDELKQTGYKNLSLKYRGWMNDGIKHSVLSSIKPVSELGSKKDLQELINHANDLQVPLYLEGTVGTAYNTGTFDGFVVNRDAVKTAGREVLELYDFTIFYSPLDWFDCHYLLKPQLTVEYMQNLSDYAKSNSANVAFSDIGYIVGGNYDPKNLTTRNQVVDMHRSEMEKIAADGTKVMVNKGNDYVLPYVDYITNMDLFGSKYQIIDYMVPFYTTAIHGLINYTGESINLSSDYVDMVLKSAEAGAGLSFTFIKESTAILQETAHTYLYGTDYDRWKKEAYDIYSRYEAELGHCFNQYIIDHEYLKDGVFATTYEDGTKVFVNYTNYDFEQDGVKVPAKDYLVERR